MSDQKALLTLWEATWFPTDLDLSQAIKKILPPFLACVPVSVLAKHAAITVQVSATLAPSIGYVKNVTKTVRYCPHAIFYLPISSGCCV